MPLTAASRMVVPRSGSTKIKPSADRDDDAGENDPAFERVHLPLRTVAIPGEHDDERDLDEFGRLKGQRRAT